MKCSFDNERSDNNNDNNNNNNNNNNNKCNLTGLKTKSIRVL